MATTKSAQPQPMPSTSTAALEEMEKMNGFNSSNLEEIGNGEGDGDHISPVLSRASSSTSLSNIVSGTRGEGDGVTENKLKLRQDKDVKSFFNDSKGWNTLRRTALEAGSSGQHPVNQAKTVPRSWGYNNPFSLSSPKTFQQNGIPSLSPHFDCPEQIWRGEPLYEIASGFYVTTQGLVSVHLNRDVRVDMTVDQAIRVISHSRGIIVALNSNGTSAALIHPCGRVYQYGSRVEISTTERGNSKFAKMFFKGVSFTSEQSALTYLVDQAGTRTVTDTFSDTSGDFSVPVFLLLAKHGFSAVVDWYRALQDLQYWISSEGSENWSVNGVRISMTSGGIVRVTRGPSKYNIRLGMNGSATITTPYVHATASVTGTSSHLFAKRGERRLHFDGNIFIVRNGGHSAGIDDESKLKVF